MWRVKANIFQKYVRVGYYQFVWHLSAPCAPQFCAFSSCFQKNWLLGYFSWTGPNEHISPRETAVLKQLWTVYCLSSWIDHQKLKTISILWKRPSIMTSGTQIYSTLFLDSSQKSWSLVKNLEKRLFLRSLLFYTTFQEVLKLRKKPQKIVDVIHQFLYAQYKGLT